MKKLLLLLIVLPLTTYAANMCVKNDTLLVVLDPNIAPTSTSYDNNARTWSATFSFGTVSGIAGCAGTGSSVGTSTSVGQKTISQSAMNLNGTMSSGVMCGCKMLLPVETYWINGQYMSATGGAACGTICAQRCASALTGTAVTVRAGIFGNVIP